MLKRWIGLALLASCVCHPAAVQAQKWSCGEMGPGMAGPLSPKNAPPGPSGDLSLPANIPNAWCEPEPPPCVPCEVYVFLGGMALQRQGMGNAPVTFITTPAVQVVRDLNDAWPNMAPGARGTVGVRQGVHSLEVTGFQLPPNESADQIDATGALNSFFINQPAGFAFFGTANNTMRTTLRSIMTDGEVNYRRSWFDGFESLIGFRYLNLNERLSILASNGTPTTTGTHSLRAINQIYAGQVGFEAAKALAVFNCRVALGCGAKGAWGFNQVAAEQSLVRGDGLQGFANDETRQLFTQVYETNVFVDILAAERFRVRAGYIFMAVIHAAFTPDNLDFNLADQTIIGNDDGCAF
ncbi:MAG: BBP7 family outer membrane beta-barrel protein [Planctomycetia bacterium]|nr:BBP7 family outer membrane beta-barrel protein [Planctomycetia bacterium]